MLLAKRSFSCITDKRKVLLTTDIVILEFTQYTAGSRWRQTVINRKHHIEKGNEIDGFYGGIRKLHSKEEITRWKNLWPTKIVIHN